MSEHDALELNKRRDVAESAVRAAGHIKPRLLNYGRSKLEAQDAIRNVIRAAFPQDLIVEEKDGAAAEELRGHLGRCWLTAPLDGPVDDHAFPFFGPAVAFVVGGRPVVSAVHVLDFDETFTAAKGQGAMLDGRAIRVAAAHPSDRSVILGGDGPGPSVDELLSRLSGWRLPPAHGSPLAALCYLATGRIDAFTMAKRNRLGPCYLAAGALLVEEAGGVLAGPPGAGFDLMASAVCGASHAALLEKLWLHAGARIPQASMIRQPFFVSAPRHGKSNPRA